jgi:hypothetical protein
MVEFMSPLPAKNAKPAGAEVSNFWLLGHGTGTYKLLACRSNSFTCGSVPEDGMAHSHVLIK